VQSELSEHMGKVTQAPVAQGQRLTP
jgi:hypothetical protein